MYFNFRCRKCKQIFSVNKDLIPNISLSHGIKINKSTPHDGCIIEDGEKVFCDLISESERPLYESITTIGE